MSIRPRPASAVAATVVLAACGGDPSRAPEPAQVPGAPAASAPGATPELDRMQATTAQPGESPRESRLRAVRLLRMFGPVAGDELVAAIADPDPEVSAAAADALGAIGPEVLPSIERGLVSPDLRIREGCAAALRRMGTPAQDFVDALLASPDAERRRLGALARAGTGASSG